jgi:hypothetical protein
MQRFNEHFRLPESLVKLSWERDASQKQGFFCLGGDTPCFGTCAAIPVADSPAGRLHDALDYVRWDGDVLHLPFDPDQVIENLLLERYSGPASAAMRSFTHDLYYFVRSVLPVNVRKHLQRAYLKGWESIPFPRWPVDATVGDICEHLLAVILRGRSLDAIPFIWFWPKGYDACAIVTHDVESKKGRDFVPALMDMDSSFGIRSSFQIIPEERYSVDESYLASIRDRGCEINVHDLNHDGTLFEDERKFSRLVPRVNQWGKRFQAAGFRAGSLYRNQQWFHLLDFAYDMSVPNVAHLDPQRGGCCSVLPYRIGNLVELPVTVIQDYSLFVVLNQYSTGLWRRQIDAIREKHGLVNLITHPDYLMETRAQETYRELLAYLASVRDHQGVWMTTPGEVNAWWRTRNALQLVPQGSGWRIEGKGSGEARIAYASLQGKELVFHSA